MMSSCGFTLVIFLEDFTNNVYFVVSKDMMSLQWKLPVKMLVIANVVKLCITLNLPIRRLIIDSQFHPPILVKVDRHSVFCCT